MRPDFLTVVAFLPPTPLPCPGGCFPTDHQGPLALGAGDSIPCFGTAVSSIQSSAWSLCRQHPEGGARGGTAEVRGQPLLAQGPWPPALKEAHTVTDIQMDPEAQRLRYSQRDGTQPGKEGGGVLLKSLTARGTSEYVRPWRCFQLSGPGPTRPYCGSTHTSVTKLSSESPSRASTSTSLSSSVEKLEEERP